MPVWTEEQLQAINAYGFPVIVSAAAGSGKTAVLVQRTIRLLCDEKLKIPADTLLAVTFTNDAAAQMREKLSAALDDAALKYPDSSWIQKQQSLLRLADICTINSFCFDMVRNNLSSTDFQSGIRIMEDNETNMITDRALNEVMEESYSLRPEETEELISLFCHENDTALRDMILKLYKFLRSLPFRGLWCRQVISSFEDGSRLQDALSYMNERFTDCQKTLASLSKSLRDTTEKLSHYSSAVGIFLNNCDYAELLSRLSIEENREKCRATLENQSWLDLRSARQSKAEKLDTDEGERMAYEYAKNCLAAMKDKAAEMAECCKYSKDQMLNDAELTKNCFEKILSLTERLFDRVAEKKLERNAVDFADTELMTVNMLVNCDDNGRLTRTPLAEEIRSSGRYKLILIDEFQDVNNLQDVIFKAISDSDDMTAIGKNVFAVGDVKQAIYRFRQANPMIFMNTRLQGQRGEGGVKEMLLTRNFRSRGSVLDFSNYIFSSLMDKNLGEVDYTDSEKLIRGSDFPGKDVPCTIIPVNTTADEESGEALDEFSAIARKIRSMIAEGVPVKDGESTRPCRPGDFCVLTRNNIVSDAVSESFKGEGLKIVSSGVAGYLKSREISLMLNLLSVIVSPMRDIPMASVLLSPIMGFSDDDIALVRLHNKNVKLYKCITEIASLEEHELYKKCKGVVELIRKLRIYSAGLPLTRLIKKIYDLTDIFSMAAAYEDGRQKCANLYLLLEYARSYERSSNDGIAGFLRYIDYISKSGGDFAEALTITESDDAVNVKTIHRSKGLEYPFVFVCQLSKRFQRRDLQGRMLLNSSCGVGMSFLDYSTLTKHSTVFSEHISQKNASELLSEELRLLYVALTRAKERLFILLDVNDKTAEHAAKMSLEITSDKVPPALSQKAGCVQDWLIMALIKHPQMSFLRDAIPGDIYTDLRQDIPDILVEPPLPAGSLGMGEEGKEKTCNADSEMINRIRRSFSFENDSRLVQTEAKVSVSELVGDDPIAFFPKVPMLDDTVSELTAAQRGTLMHRFMQLCDFNNAANDLEKEIDRLRSAGSFTEKEAASLSRKALKAFFGSEMYNRMSASKNVMRERSFIVKFRDVSLDAELERMYAGTDGMLQGIADCIFEEPSGYVIVDYKTDKVSSLEELRDRYSAQLILYKAAFDILLDKPIISCYIYSYRLAQGIEVVLQ